jgi:antirestriction protein ArdC
LRSIILELSIGIDRFADGVLKVGGAIDRDRQTDGEGKQMRQDGTSPHGNVYDIVTERILRELEKGTAPWRKPWTTAAPMNMATRKAYRGVNVWLLGISSSYRSPFWGTFNQAKAAGGSVRKGEKASLVVFYRQYERDARPGDGGTIRELPDGRLIKESWVLRYYNVFNTDQMDLPEKVRTALQPPARSAAPLEDAEKIITGMPNPPALEFGHDQAAYHPVKDTVYMPNRDRFPRPEDYFDTLFHEEVHATGHASRLDRPGITDGAAAFGSETYSKEELVAELGAAFLCGTARIAQRTLENSAAYLRGWVSALQGDSRLIVTAASAAQSAADYILGKSESKSDIAAGEVS